MTPEFLPIPEHFDPDAYLEAAAAAVDLSIAPAHRPGVLTFLDLAARMAGHVAEFELPDTMEPAPVFKP